MDIIANIFQKIILIKKIDEHIIIRLFGIKLCFKYKHNIKEIEITSSGVTETKRNPKIVVSLTSYPKTINEIHKTIKTLLNQTMKPDVVVLWLSESQFEGKKLPQNLVNLEKYGLTIKWCEDIRSFKKLIPSLKEYPDDIIITVDDDFYYPNNLVQNLYTEYEKNPNVIHANRAFVVKQKPNGEFEIKSRNIIYDKTYKPSFYNELMTGSGVIYPPHCFSDEIFNKDKFLKIIPTNDDVWIFAMAVLNRTKIEVNKKGFDCALLGVENTQETSLCKINNGISKEGCHGSLGVNIMIQHYPEIKKILSEEKNGR